ncbi:long-chain-alcohol O-fatty-acyltransferase-like [Chenopodium quinoa]|uniref:long-chain-alcohol O-fatty-acyltransferase-like n=1 Tax=Chenopodium quinoa TaxID=63459 RepID=UPI000B7862D4|nr:long-chain-alcohol O-fatty-acyltransferase-like [Chenopodium quinoa]
MEGEIKSFLRAWSILLSSLCYCYFIAFKIPKGKLRFIFLLPCFFLFTIFPLSFSSVILKGIISYFITYVGNFKLLLFSYDLGPLSDCLHNPTTKLDKQKGDPPIKITSLIRFILVAIFPMKIKDPISKKQKTKKVIPLTIWHEALLFSILSTYYYAYKRKLHSCVIWISYCGIMYLFLDVIVVICNKLAKVILDVELHPPFDEPYLSTSLQDFWSRRWNLMVTDVLRHTIYVPMRVFLSKDNVRQQKVLIPSVMTVFLVSGLIHELIFYYLTFVNPTWEVTCFFGLNGILVILESYLKRNLGRKLRLHWALSGPLSLGLVMGTGYLLFFPPFLRNQVDVRIAEEAKALFKFIGSQLF